MGSNMEKKSKNPKDPKVPKTPKTPKLAKSPFSLNLEDMDKFEYKDLYLITEIKDELNRITTAENVKHIFGTDIFKLLTQLGYVEEQTIDGRVVQVRTEAGLAKGIATVEKISKLGNPYTVLMYPPEIQREIVLYYGKMQKGSDPFTEA